MTEHQKKVIKAWGVHFDEVRDSLNKEGWYDGGNDKVQKTFEGLEVTKMMYHQIPTILLVKEEDKKEEAVKEPAISKQNTKRTLSTKK